jgi:hypothetical protein
MTNWTCSLLGKGDIHAEFLISDWEIPKRKHTCWTLFVNCSLSWRREEWKGSSVYVKWTCLIWLRMWECTNWRVPHVHLFFGVAACKLYGSAYPAGRHHSVAQTGDCTPWREKYTRGLETKVGSSWNLMAHGDAREGKCRGNWWMEWVAS